MTLKKRANKKGIVNNLLHMYNLSLYFPDQKMYTSANFVLGITQMVWYENECWNQSNARISSAKKSFPWTAADVYII